jgi:hypothetical protein
MPLFSGVSATTSLMPVFLKPKPATHALFFAKRPMVVLTNVNFNCAILFIP